MIERSKVSLFQERDSTFSRLKKKKFTTLNELKYTKIHLKALRINYLNAIPLDKIALITLIEANLHCETDE